MPTVLVNQARITYSYPGGETEVADSNETVTTLLDEYSLSAEKFALTEDFRPGNYATYQVLVTNNGRGPVYNVTITDNLGGTSAPLPLTFVEGTARVFQNGDSTVITPTVTEDGLTFTLTEPLEAGESALLTYVASVRNDLSNQVDSITNTAQVTGNGGSPNGPTVEVTPAPTSTITRDTFADVFIFKQADKDTVVSGETLTYTFTLSNSGSVPATDVVLTDTLPENFTVTQVSLTVNGSTVVVPATDYTIDANNTITLPAPGADTVITVPAASNGVPGTASVVITGVVNA